MSRRSVSCSAAISYGESLADSWIIVVIHEAPILKSGVERPHLGWIHKLQEVPMRKS